jgi:hypothetical protein
MERASPRRPCRLPFSLPLEVVDKTKRFSAPVCYPCLCIIRGRDGRRACVRPTPIPQPPSPNPHPPLMRRLSPDQALLRAAGRGDIGGARDALARGATALDEALAQAASDGYTLMASYLIDCGADIRSDDERALSVAARAGRVETVRMLLDRGADIMAPVALGVTRGELLAGRAVARGNAEMLALLLERGVLLPREGAGLLLESAALAGNLQMVELLLASGADASAAGAQALSAAAAKGHVQIVQLLLDAGANPRAGNHEALRRAMRADHRETAKALREAGANPRWVEAWRRLEKRKGEKEKRKDAG